MSMDEVFTGAAAYRPRAIAGDLAGRHIVTVEQFARPDLDALFADASRLRARSRVSDASVQHLCAGMVLATLFYEASTRTDMSFQAAMLRLGGEVVATSGGVQFSSVYKGENLADSVRAAGCYADVIVLRHPAVRSSYEAAFHLDQLADRLGRRPVVISGGDGVGEHPSQALLDLYTIIDTKGTADGLRVLMVGDLSNGRTVHSLAKLLALHGARDTRLDFVSPASLRMPREALEFVAARGLETGEHDDLDAVLPEADVIYWTRVQQERFDDPAAYEAIADRFVMTPAVMARARPDAILMHPLPRRHEMGTVADHLVLDADRRSVYFHQMENGMYVRMALLAGVLRGGV
jgi:aspartate carbamoyltransferase